MIECVSGGELEVNAYVVGDERECLVIDPGLRAALLLPALRARRVTALLLTHTHYDHIAGVDELRDLTGAPLYAPEGEEAALLDPLGNLSGLFGGGVICRPAEHTVEDGDAFRIGGASLTAIATPGHSPGHLAYAGEGVVFTGDALFAGSVGRTDFPGSSAAALLDSLRNRLFTLPDETVVYPGHGPATTIGEERRTNPYLEELL